ncbi:Alpha/Beta hydrolase protein [Powellomyces hirtus]|nr:Alpha/Beta hydrolase protein [Powellomyces hirtus]
MGFADAIQWLLKYATYLGVTAATGGVFLLYFYQNSLIYPANFPTGSRTVVATPDEAGMPEYENLTITTRDNVKIKAYYIPYRKASEAKESEGGLRNRTESQNGEIADTTVLYCHANAGNMGHRLPIARVFHTRFKTNVVMFSYRGYGTSEGSPSEKGLKIDAQATLNWILAHPQLKHTKIVVYGQSIGGAVAINLAATNQEHIAALIVENTFLTLRKLIPFVMPMIRYFTFLCHQIWDSEAAIKTIPKMPIMLLSGGRDELIPSEQMLALCCAARNARGRPHVTGKEETFETDRNDVRFVVFPNGTHNETCVQPGYFDAVLAFWNTFVVGNGSPDGARTSSGTVPHAVPRKGAGGLVDAVKAVQKGGAGANSPVGL